MDGVERREGKFEVYNFEVKDFHTYFVSDLEILVHNACAPNANLESLPIHPYRTRFFVRADELTVSENIKTMHPINSDQLLGSERVNHAGVSNLSNEDLFKLGGPQGDDPIRGFRQHALGDDLRFPGSEIHIRGGHHRIHEIGRRVTTGDIEPDTLLEVLIEDFD